MSAASIKRNLAGLQEAPLDVLVIGGGITGAGVARHAALAGLNVGLVERGDHGEGTSSRSTKLIHGGLRYLAMGDVALVRKTARERTAVQTLAPHFAQPRWMLLPVSTRTAYMKYRAAVTLYEQLGQVGKADRHQRWRNEEISEHEPVLNARAFPMVCAYREYLTDDARLVVAVLRAAAAAGAVVANRVSAEHITPLADGARVTCRDMLEDHSFEVQARVVVNATGPWVSQLVPDAASKPRLQLSKGVHLAFPWQMLPVRNILMLEAADGRPVFVVPKGAVTYVGTTDTAWPLAEHRPAVQAEDIRYLLDTVSRYVHDVPDESDLAFTWSGLRTLVYQTGKSPKEMSRKEEIWTDGNVLSIAGGKLTGFRDMAEEIMMRVGTILGHSCILNEPLRPLPGGDHAGVDAVVRELSGVATLTPAQAERLAECYGSEARLLIANQPLQEIGGGFFRSEIYWAVDVEGACSVDDIMSRRMRVHWYAPKQYAEIGRNVVDALVSRGDLTRAAAEQQLSVYLEQNHAGF